MTIDYTQPTGQIRLLIADVDDDPLIDDEQLAGYLALNDDSVRRAAADALDAIADSETLVSKKIRTQDLQTDGPATATSLRAHAARLRAQADADESFVEIIDFAPSACPELTERRY